MLKMKNDNKNKERLWNLIMFNVYVTDDEMNKIAPFVIITLIALIVLILIFV